MKTTLQLVALAMGAETAVAASHLDRTVLPISEPEYAPYTELDVRKTQPPPRFEVKAPADAPNVAIILIDDLGFGATTTFGGFVPSPQEVVNRGGLGAGW